MPNGSMAPHETSGPADAVSARLRYELREMLDTDRSRGGTADVSPDFVLGLLAGLLIAKWAACDESERKALAAFDEQAFTLELPEALGLPAWEEPASNHAGAVVEALRGVTTNNGAKGAAACYVTRIAPLVIFAAESSPEMYVPTPRVPTNGGRAGRCVS